MNNTSSLQGPPMFQMPNMTPAANNAFTGIGNLSQFGNIGTGVLPQAQQTSQNLYNNPFAGAGLNASQQAALMGQGAATTGYGMGGTMAGAYNQVMPYANQIMQTGFDPQQALYNRTLQQVQDQSNVENMMAGVGTTPYGAGVTDQAMANFNIDWQNQQLGRQTQAAGAYGGLLNQGAGITGQGVNMMNQAPGQFLTSSMLPYATYSDIGQGQNQALSQLLGLTGTAQGISNVPIQDYFSYLGVGNQAGQVANQNFANQLAQQQQAWNQDMQFGQGIGSMIGAVAPFFGV